MFDDHPGRAASFFLATSSLVELANDQFTGNAGGGMTLSGGGAMRLAGCTFSNNHADAGAGIDGSGSAGCSLWAKDCRFLGNAAGTAGTGDGGAAVLNGVSATFANCWFSGNTAGVRGGAIQGINPSTSMHLQNCVFTGNSASHGGGVACVSAPATLANCTFFHNSASTSVGGLYSIFGNSQPMLGNCILWLNQRDRVFDDFHSAMTVRESNIQGGWSGLGANNINIDPLFVDADGPDNVPGNEDDNLRLRPARPRSTPDSTGWSSLTRPTWTTMAIRPNSRRWIPITTRVSPMIPPPRTPAAECRSSSITAPTKRPGARRALPSSRRCQRRRPRECR